MSHEAGRVSSEIRACGLKIVAMVDHRCWRALANTATDLGTGACSPPRSYYPDGEFEAFGQPHPKMPLMLVRAAAATVPNEHCVGWRNVYQQFLQLRGPSLNVETIKKSATYLFRLVRTSTSLYESKSQKAEKEPRPQTISSSGRKKHKETPLFSKKFKS
ncbi:hypothetical protein BC827DRAFT_947599 [Russula dissimulans]|nr:hypothetical protein BC827DRAFT_947599 [Russula dissimulans]